MLNFFIINGRGPIGLPLTLCFTYNDVKVSVYDVNQSSIDIVNNTEIIPLFTEQVEKGLI